MVGGDTGTVSGSEQDSASCANSESAMKIESTATPVSDQATNIESSDDNCAETSGAAAESPPQTENHESQDSGVTRCTVTKGTQSTELGADSSMISSKDSNSTTTNSSSHPRRKLSKQDNVNERYSPTCTGPIEQDYVSPTTCCGSVSVKSSVADESLIATNSAGIKCTDNDAWVTTTIGNVQRRPESETTNSFVMPPTHGSVSNETTHLQPTTANGQSHLAPLVNHSYEGFIPSRARQLVRSLAMCGDDDTRLRPPPRQVVNSFASMRPFGFPMQSKQSSSSLSRESSYTDHTSDLGDMELRSFIVATLHKNPRDRALILELEQIFVDFICNSKEQSIKLPPVSSYTRMIIHRIAVLFGLDHNVDNSGKCVVVSKTDRTKRPDFVFASLIQSNIFTDTRRVCATPWNCREYAVGELARRAQSFESACFPPNTETDLSQQGHPWSLKSQRSFENQHFPYYVGFINQGPVMRKAGSFGGIPTNYQANGGFGEAERSQGARAFLSPHQLIDETMERFSNISCSDSASQINNRSSSITPAYSGMCPEYPQVIQVPYNEEIICVPISGQQQVFMEPTSSMTSSSVEMFSSQPAIMVSTQPNPAMQQTVPTMPSHQQEHLNNSEATQEETAHVMPLPPECVDYYVHQYPSQVGGCYARSYQFFTQPSLPTHFQQVVFHQQHEHAFQHPLIHAQQSYLQPQHYTTASIQSINHSQYYQPLIHQQVQSHYRYMSTQPVIQGYSHLNCHQQSKQSQTGAVTIKQRRQYLEAPKSEQHGLNGRVTCGQWLTGEQCRDCVNEVKSYNLDTQRSETHVIPTPRILCKQLQTGRTVFSPLSVFPHPEPMYHYSQISPAMSSMHQQQILHVQCHSRPLLYKPTPYFGRQITSIDGGYCSMNQDSVREDDPEVTDPQ